MKQKILTNLKENWWKYLIVFLIIGLDMLTKFLLVPLDANNNVDYTKTSEKGLIGNFLWFAPTTNLGAGFSILEGKTLLLIILSFIFIIGFIFFDIYLSKKSKLYNIAFGLTFGGAVGNLIDRMAFGGRVRDFIFFKFINFPVFNVADMALTIGIVLFLIWLLFVQPKEKDIKNAENKPEQIQTEKVENLENIQKNTENKQ